MHIHSLILGRTFGMDAAIAKLLVCSDTAEYSRAFPELDKVTASPGIILVCQQWPEEYTREQISRLLETFPLARIVVSYSPWCASDGRTRDLWPIAVRVEAIRAPQRIENELEVLRGNRVPLPLTAGYDEIFAFDHSA